jgi:hypothetical protein
MNYIILGIRGLTKGNLSLLNSTHNKKGSMSKPNRLIIAGVSALITVPLIYPANTHFKRRPDFTGLRHDP